MGSHRYNYLLVLFLRGDFRQFLVGEWWRIVLLQHPPHAEDWKRGTIRLEQSENGGFDGSPKMWMSLIILIGMSASIVYWKCCDADAATKLVGQAKKNKKKAKGRTCSKYPVKKYPVALLMLCVLLTLVAFFAHTFRSGQTRLASPNKTQTTTATKPPSPDELSNDVQDGEELQKPLEQDFIRFSLAKQLIAGQVKDAVKGAEQASADYPTSGKVMLLLADTYARDKNYTAALAAYTRAKDMTTDSGEDQSKCLTWMGVCLRRLGRTQEAFQYLHLAVESADDSNNNIIEPGRDSYVHLALSYQMDNQHVAAVRWWAKALENSPDKILRAKDIQRLADVLRIISHWRLLSTALQACLLACPDYIETYPEYKLHMELAGALEQILEEGYKEEAEDHWEKAAQVSGQAVEQLRQEYETSILGVAERTRPIVTDMPQMQHEREALLEDLDALYKPVFGGSQQSVSEGEASLATEEHVSVILLRI